MAIKVKHGGNIAPVAVAGYGSGRGRKQSQTGNLVNRGDVDTAPAVIPRMATGGRSNSRSSSNSRTTGVKPVSVQDAAIARGKGLLDDQMNNIRQTQANFLNDMGNRVPEFNEGGYTRGGTYDYAGTASNAPASGAPGSPVVSQPEVRQEYTPKQVSKYNQLSDALEDARSSGIFTEEDWPEVEKQIIEQQTGIKPVSRMSQPSMSTSEQFQKSTYRDPDTGALIGFKADGTPFKLTEPPKAESEDAGGMDDKTKKKYYDDAAKDLTGYGESATSSEIAKLAMKNYEEDQKAIAAMGGGAVEAAPTTAGRIQATVDSVKNLLASKSAGMMTSGDQAVYNVGGKIFGSDNRSKNTKAKTKSSKPQNNNKDEFAEMWGE